MKYLLKSKDQTFECFKIWRTRVETQTEKKLKYFRTDNGLEFLGNNFNSRCDECGITRQRTIAYTPQQNEVAKRMNRTLMERVRCICYQKPKLLKHFGQKL